MPGQAGEPLSLSNLSTSPRFFSKDRHEEFVSLSVYENSFDSTNHRTLPINELDVLALNEIAASHKNGYFFHLPNRNSGSKVNFNRKAVQDPVQESRRTPSQGYLL